MLHSCIQGHPIALQSSSFSNSIPQRMTASLSPMTQLCTMWPSSRLEGEIRAAHSFPEASCQIVIGTLRALLPVRMSFSCSGRMTCQSSGARPSVMLARTILRSGRQWFGACSGLTEAAGLG